MVVRRLHGHGRLGLEAFLAGRQRGAGRPEVHLREGRGGWGKASQHGKLWQCVTSCEPGGEGRASEHGNSGNMLERWLNLKARGGEGEGRRVNMDNFGNALLREQGGEPGGACHLGKLSVAQWFPEMKWTLKGKATWKLSHRSTW